MTRLLQLLGAIEPPSPAGSQAIVLALALALIGAIGTSGFQFYKYRKQAKREDDSLIATATGEAVKAAQAMLEQYRLEFTRLNDSFRSVQAQLVQAAEKIARLEADLLHSHEDRDRLSAQLVRAVEERTKLMIEFERMKIRLADLEELLQGSINREAAREGHRRKEDNPKESKDE